METGLTKNQIINELSRSPHGKLEEYISVGKTAAATEPEFFAHLISYDRVKGQIRDAKVALPVISLSVPTFPEDFEENSFAHIAKLGPRELERAYRFALQIRLPGKMRKLRRLVESYLRNIETNKRTWEHVATQHKATLATLYALSHTKKSSADDPEGKLLFYRGNGPGAHPDGSMFALVKQLQSMTPTEAAGMILEKNIPFLIAQGALGKKIEDPDLILALMKRMTPVQFVTSQKMLEKLGVKNNPALRGAYDEAMERASKSTRNVLKTTRASENMTGDAKEKLVDLQERQIKAMKGVEGDWLVLGDKSSSMSQAIETATLVAATLAKMVKGKVHLVFFDTMASRVFDVTGKTYEAIKTETKHVSANGNTSIGSGLQWAIDKKIVVDGIAIVSDGGENTAPIFAPTYANYSKIIGKEVPVYLYQCRGDNPVLIHNMKVSNLDLQVFDIMNGVDFYSLPNLCATMRTQRYGLVEEIMEFPLLSLGDVFKQQQHSQTEEPVAV